MFGRVGQRGGAYVGAEAVCSARPCSSPAARIRHRRHPGRSVYGALLESGQADVFITYCTNAVVAVAEEPSLRALLVPAAINVTADYGLAVRQQLPAAAQAFADFLLSATGQAILQRHGFQRPD